MIKLFVKYRNMLRQNGITGTLIYIRYELRIRFSRIRIFITRLREPELTVYKEYYESCYENSRVKSDSYLDYRDHDIKIKSGKIKYIAFYLPQFHPVPENDEWWGKGFTEWTNVSKAVPEFPGHYQPHLPGELGFYDLRVSEVQKRQVELAKNYGVYGFCFYYYWFGGRRILEMPVENFIADNEIDFPFCLCWANENWTRRWDGKDNEILLKQFHSPDDDIKFIQTVSKYFESKNYIRIEGKPLLLVYRPSLLPEPEATAERWRRYCRDIGIGDIYLAYTMSFDKVSPDKFGFDGAVEFPPNNSRCSDVSANFDILNRNFSGRIYNYNELADKMMSPFDADYDVYRGVTPSWDNSSRKPGGGSIYYGSTPGKFQEWVQYVRMETIKLKTPEKRLIFINAWNEWAEGAHLEPDRKYGYAYLDAIAQSMSEIE